MSRESELKLGEALFNKRKEKGFCGYYDVCNKQCNKCSYVLFIKEFDSKIYLKLKYEDSIWDSFVKDMNSKKGD